jgi:2-dehydropantoate 2-reductase
MASFLGARLAESHVQVTLAGSWPEGLEALAREGVLVDDGGASERVRLAAVPLSGPLPEADEVVVLTKAYRTAEVAPRAGRSLAPGASVTTFQNGLGNVEILARQANGVPVRQGVATYGAALLGPGRVRIQPGSFLLEPGALARTLSAAGLEVETTTAIETEVWRKLAVNCAVNPLSAILGLRNGALLEDPALRERLGRVAREVEAVAKARGTPLGTDAVRLVEDVARKTSGNRSSMLQDLDRGFRTENEALSGALVREGRRLGVETPENEALYAAVRERETAR